MTGPLQQRIAEKRKREGLSLREAGEASGVAFSTLARIENGAEPANATYHRIVAWLDGKAPVLPPPPMTLRDWFSGQALAGLSMGCAGLLGGEFSAYAKGSCNAALADRAFVLADAMLAEREKVRS